MRKVLIKAIDLITGFNLDAELNRVLEMDTWSREAIEQYQQEKFELLRKHAVRSEIYKDCVNTNYSKFPKFPKEYVQKNLNKFRTSSADPYRLIYTSGSTGNPKKIYLTKEMLLAKRTSYLKMLQWHNINREDKEVYIGGLQQNFTTQIYYYIKNKVFLPSNNITIQKAGEYIKIINKHKPKILFAYPFALDIILNYAEHLKQTLHQPEVIYTAGSNLYPDVKQHIQEHFPDSKMVNEYWSTEANIGVTCPEGKIHADEDTIYIETDNLDKNGFGDILITNFYSYALPLIRYDLGDRIKLSDVPCSCCRKTKIIEEIEGRNADYYYLKDGRRIAYLDMRISKFVDNIIQYQVIHFKKDDTFVFKYIPRDPSKLFEKASLQNFFKKELDVELNFQEVEFISSEASGKFNPFKSI